MLTLGLRHIRGKLSRPHCKSHLLFRSTGSLRDFVYTLIPSKTGPGAEMEVIFSMKKLYWVYLGNIHPPCHMGSLTVPSFPLNLCATIKKDFLLSVKHQADFNIALLVCLPFWLAYLSSSYSCVSNHYSFQFSTQLMPYMRCLSLTILSEKEKPLPKIPYSPQLSSLFSRADTIRWHATYCSVDWFVYGCPSTRM